jgi:hypothetical protein
MLNRYSSKSSSSRTRRTTACGKACARKSPTAWRSVLPLATGLTLWPAPRSGSFVCCTAPGRVPMLWSSREARCSRPRWSWKRRLRFWFRQWAHFVAVCVLHLVQTAIYRAAAREHRVSPCLSRVHEGAYPLPSFAPSLPPQGVNWLVDHYLAVGAVAEKQLKYGIAIHRKHCASVA